MLAGLASGVTEAIIVNPFEVIKVKMQSNRAHQVATQSGFYHHLTFECLIRFHDPYISSSLGIQAEMTALDNAARASLRILRTKWVDLAEKSLQI
jgi:hypothetical protein